MSWIFRQPKPWVRKLLAVLFWLLVWQLASLAVRWGGKPMLLASPGETLRVLLALLPQPEFWLAAGTSLGRVALGFFLAFLAGLALGAAAWRFSWVADLLAPLLALMKSVPVASFVILVLVWFGSGSLSVIVCFLIVFPQMYFATAAGLRAADGKLVEMARVFRFSPWQLFFQVYRPPLAASLVTACSSALGMSWKSGIAAEVIGTPAHSIGEALYLSKVYVMTAEIFAWTAVVLVLSALFERTVLILLRKAGE